MYFMSSSHGNVGIHSVIERSPPDSTVTRRKSRRLDTPTSSPPLVQPRRPRHRIPGHRAHHRPPGNSTGHRDTGGIEWFLTALLLAAPGGRLLVIARARDEHENPWHRALAA